MTFVDSISTCFRKFTDINGRASRSEYWWFYLFCVMVNIAIFMVSILIGYLVADIIGMILFGNIGVYILIPIVSLLLLFAVTIRRLHDT